MIVTQNFSHRLAQECLIDKFRVGAFRILRDNQLKEVWILPETVRSDQRAKQNSYHFTVRKAREQETMSSYRAPCLGSNHMEIWVHSTFLNRNGHLPLRPADSHCVELLDPAATELALVLQTTEGTGQFGTSIISYMVGMLCIRLTHVLTQMQKVQLHTFEDWQLSKLEEALSRQFIEGTSVAYAAAQCRLSVCQFSRLFKATYGMPLRKYLARHRLKQAQTQLAESEDPISQIALECGFADQSTFTRLFTRVIGIPPGVWRRQNKQHNPSISRRSGLTITVKIRTGLR